MSSISCNTILEHLSRRPFSRRIKKKQGCSILNGALAGALVLLALSPLVVASFMGDHQRLLAAPTGVAGSILLAVYLGGVAVIWIALLPTAVAIVILGRFVKMTVEIGLYRRLKIKQDELTPDVVQVTKPHSCIPPISALTIKTLSDGEWTINQ